MHILDLGIAHTTGCPISDLLECVRGLVLWNDGSSSPMTLGNNRISVRHFNEGPVMVVYQKSGTLNQTMTHCRKHFAGGTAWMKGVYCITRSSS